METLETAWLIVADYQLHVAYTVSVMRHFAPTRTAATTLSVSRLPALLCESMFVVCVC